MWDDQQNNPGNEACLQGRPELETPWFLGFQQMRRFVTLYHVVSLILANAMDNWGTRPTPNIQHYILWSFMPIVLYGVKIIFFNACNLCRVMAE